MGDTASNTIRDLLRDFVNASTWSASRQIVTQHQAVLLTGAADADFAAWTTDDTATNEMVSTEALTWYRDVLQRCRTEGIDVTFDHLPEPRPLNKALQAFLNANEPDALGQMIQDFPEVTSERASQAIRELIVRKMFTDLFTDQWNPKELTSTASRK